MEYSSVGKTVQVLINGVWTEGFIDEYHPERGYYIQYFDGDSDWIKELDKNHVKIDQEDQGNHNEGKEDLDDINFFDETANDEEELAIISNPPQKRNSKPIVPPLDSLKEENMKKADEKVSSRHNSRPASSRSRRGEGPSSNRDPVDRGLDDDIMKSVDELEHRKNSARQDLDHKNATPRRSHRSDSNDPVLDTKETDLNRTLEDENELEIISNPPAQQVHRNSKPKIPPFDPRKEENMKNADEKLSSRPTTSRSRPTTSRSRQRDEVMTNMDLTSEDELLMAVDLDDDIMMRDVDDLDDNNHVVVHTYETEEEASPLQKNLSNRDLDHKDPKPSRSPRYDPADTLLDMEDGDFNEQNIEEVAKPLLDIEHYQMRSHDFILTQSPSLQTRSVLLVGSVLSASVQPSSTSTMKEEFNAASREEFFFRVLFIEGGNQPIMLRCKTPIFTSDTTTGHFSTYTKEFQPFWKENFYRCDLQMPSEDLRSGKGSGSSVAGSTTSKRPHTGKRSSVSKPLSTIAEGKEDIGERTDTIGYQNGISVTPFPVSGDIVISVYKVRRNGGNDLMGQMIVELKKMSQEGAYEFYNEICEGRSYSGKFPLTLPSNNGNKSQAISVGEIELHLSIAWKVPSNNPALGLTNQLSAINGSPLTRPKSVTGSVASVAVSKKPTATVATTVKKKTAEQPRKIVSAQARKQKEDQKRIEMENKKLQQAIQKNSGKTSTGAYSNNPTTATKPLVNNFITPSITADAKSVTMKDMKGKAITQDDVLYQKYLTLYNQLKKNISDEEDAITSLKARYNNTNIQIKKFQTSIEKAKLASQSGGGGTSVVSRSSRISRQPQQLPSSQTRRAESKSEREGFNRSEGKRSGDDEYDDEFEDEEGGKNKEEIRDPEYESIKEEYDVMQKLRKSLIDRIIKSKEITQRFHIDQRNIETQRQAIKNRIDAVLQYQQLQEQQAANTQLYFNEKETQFEKIQKQRQSGKANANNKDDDIEIFQTLFALEQEKQFYSELIEENPDYYALQSTYDELNQTYELLQEKYNNLTSEISKLQEQRDSLSQKAPLTPGPKSTIRRRNNNNSTNNLSEEVKEMDSNVEQNKDEIKEKRELITFLQKLLIQSDIDERSSQYLSKMKENEMQLIYLQMKQKERDELKYQEINHLRSNASLQTLSAISSIPLLSLSSGNRTNQNSADQLLHLSPSTSQLKLNNSNNNPSINISQN